MSHSLYLAGRYTRRAELCEKAADLILLGHAITASWLSEKPAWEDDGVRLGCTAAINAFVAAQDTADIDACDTLIGFTDEPGSPSRGGKDREIGYALGRGKCVLIVGPRQNCFDFHPNVTYFPDWESCLRYLQVGTFIAEATG